MRFTTAFTASALAALAHAQTFTTCNPMKKDCPNDPAMPAKFDTDFRKGAESIRGWKQTAGSLKYTSEGAQFTVAKQGEAPTIQSEGYLHFGYIEVKCKAAAGQGIVSSIVVQSEDLDEVDWEFLGGFDNKVQMNYFGKGNTTTYDRMIEAPVTQPQEVMHTYALNWTAEALVWIIDGVEVRTLPFAEANGGKNFPQTPSTVRIGIWAGGDPNNEKGVIEWAGGETDYTKAPFTMTVESVKVTNYSPGKEYEWTDRSGSHESIKVIEPGNQAGAPQNTVILEPTASATQGGLQSGINVPSGTLPATTGAPFPTGNGTSPCDCGVATVTITGSSPPPESPTFIPPPGTTVPVPTTGLIVETSPAPSVPAPSAPSAPSGLLPVPSGNATVSAPPAEFTGAATSNKAGALVAVVAGAVLFAF
ncbi:glycoside hydrolase family 16 protein [Aaosphaeria arxii CBS 175.79]|uniref:chitinase n=1 Tax=Aaosphaeria arxii CBS 175.79 TaxID=1450172 RepID=A0A6A5XRY8_9PLEO|nr:glycoside hydrolase family 16 protein [Aaosphaeria arxii CBS 175.79]KAF2015666.1 glycoside hydrolase family 16 protein [Aaosphaeria arxii CBS 175.79]